MLLAEKSLLGQEFILPFSKRLAAARDRKMQQRVCQVSHTPGFLLLKRTATNLDWIYAVTHQIHRFSFFKLQTQKHWWLWRYSALFTAPLNPSLQEPNKLCVTLTGVFFPGWVTGSNLGLVSYLKATDLLRKIIGFPTSCLQPLRLI